MVFISDDENSKTKNDTSNEEENSSAGGGQGESTAVKFSSKQDNVNIEAAINPAVNSFCSSKFFLTADL